jgi:thiamine kinase-like enzyme
MASPRNISTTVTRDFGLSSTEIIRAAKSCVPGWQNYPDSFFDTQKLTGGLTNLLTTVHLKKEKVLSLDESSNTGTGTETNNNNNKRLRSSDKTNHHHHHVAGHHHNYEEKIVLVREYGAGSDRFMNRAQEAKIIEALSEARLCPKVFGLKPWGRVEKFLHHSRTLTTEEYRSDRFVPLVGELLGSFHSRSDELLALCTTPGNNSVLGNRLQQWFDLASLVNFNNTTTTTTHSTTTTTTMNSSSTNNATDINLTAERNALKLACLNLPAIREEINWLIQEAIPSVHSPVVFSHADLQEGNVLLDEAEDQLGSLSPEGSSYAQPVSLNMIDLEYSDRMERGFDLGNCFCEQSICYKIDHFPGFVLNPDHYPTFKNQELFLKAYCMGAGISPTGETIKQLMKEARLFSLVSHLHWSIWSVIMAANSSIHFGYLEYALQRMDQYWIGKEKLLKGVEF